MKRILMAGMIVGVLLSVAACGGGSGVTQGAVPDFTLKDLDGKDFKLSAETKGKAVLINFWATWCPPCRNEIPSLVKAYKEYQGKGFVIVGISLDSQGVETVAAFVKDQGMTYPVVMGDEKTVQAYGGIGGIPTTFLVDRKGVIVQKIVGYRDEAFFMQEIEKLVR